LSFGGKLIDSLRVTKKNFTRGREADARAGSVEEADAEAVFKSADLKRDRGLGNVQRGGGLSEVQAFGCAAEDFEAEVFDK
jgi:hypothetical protein